MSKKIDALTGLDPLSSDSEDESGDEGAKSNDSSPLTEGKKRKSREEADAESFGGDSDGEGGAGGAGPSSRPDPSKRPKKGGLTLEDLQKHGYKSGPSVLFMKPPNENANANWGWSDGAANKQLELAQGEETLEDRERTRDAATTGAEREARYAQKVVAHADRLREEARAERERLKQSDRLTWNAKEKKKRAEGKVSRGTNYVEEEKRQAREFGVYSGFD